MHLLIHPATKNMRRILILQRFTRANVILNEDEKAYEQRIRTAQP
jgi:hypothetical protein